MSSRHFVPSPMLRWSALPPYLSGLVSLDATVETDLGVKRASSYYPARASDWPKAITRQWYRFNNGVPGYYWSESDLDDKLNKKLQYVPRDVDGMDWPGCFTGKMRHVVQKMHGAGRSIPFTHIATSSDGILIPDGPGLDSAKQRWVIMIRRDGVYAAPIKFVKETVPEGDTDYDRYDYYPQGTWGEKVTVVAPADLEYKNKSILMMRLLDEGDMDFLFKAGGTGSDLQPLVSRYGWAFNYTGSEAQIILIGSVAGYFHTYRLKLEFGMSGGYPICTSAMQTEGGPLYTGAATVKPFRIPGVGNVSGPVGYSANTEYDGAYSDTPVYVFYGRDNVEVLLKHSYQKAVSEPDVIVDTRGNYTGTIWADCPCRSGVTGVTDAYNNGTVTNKWNITSRANGFSCDNTISMVQASTTEFRSVYEYSLGSYGEPTFKAFCNENAYISWQIGEAIASAYRESHGTTQTTVEVTDIVGFAYNEAEGFFHYRQEVTAIPEHSVHHETANYASQYGPFRVIDSSTSPPSITTVGGIQGTAGTAGFVVTGTDTVPYTESIVKNYLFAGSIATATVILDAPEGDIMGVEDQIYSASIGAQTGNHILLPWPRSLHVSDSSYPYDGVPAFDEGELVYPDYYFIGNE